MKIALFIPTIAGGGAEKMQVHLANCLASRGHSVDLVVANAQGPILKRASADVRLVDFKKSRALWALRPLRRYLRKERPDVLVSALSHANVVAIAARLLAPFCGTRVVVTERNAIRARLASGRWTDRAMLTLMRLLYPLADRIVGVSRGVADEAREVLRLKPAKVTAIYNPVIAPDVPEQISAPTGDARFAEIERPILITVARLVPQKDQELLISAFAAIASARKASLVILGDGPKRRELETAAAAAGVADRVHFLGFVDNPLAYLARSDLFVLTSRHEGFANVIVEALACGLPVVSTDCPSGPREILDDGRYGRLVPVGDAKSLGEAMLAALDDSNDAVALRARAKDFSTDKITDQYEALFESALGQTKKSAKIKSLGQHS